MIGRRFCQHRWFDWLLLGVDDFLTLDILGLVSFKSLHSTEALWVGLHLAKTTLSIGGRHLSKKLTTLKKRLSLLLSPALEHY